MAFPCANGRHALLSATCTRQRRVAEDLSDRHGCGLFLRRINWALHRIWVEIKNKAINERMGMIAIGGWFIV